MKVDVNKIKQMKVLMGRLLDKSFDVNDQKQLKDIASYFLFVAVAIDYTDGYSLEESRCTRGSCGTIDGTPCGREFGCRCECHYKQPAKQRGKAKPRTKMAHLNNKQ